LVIPATPYFEAQYATWPGAADETDVAQGGVDPPEFFLGSTDSRLDG